MIFVSGMIGSSVIALNLVEMELEPIHEHRRSRLKDVILLRKLRKAVTFKNAQVIHSIHPYQPLILKLLVRK